MLAQPLEAVFHIRRSRSAPLGDYEAGPIPYLGNGFGSSPIAKYVTPFPGDRIFEFDAVVVSAFGEVTVQAQPFIAYGAAGTSLVVLEPRVPMSRIDLAFYAAWLATQMRGRFNWYYRSVPPRIRRFRVPESVPEGLQFAVHGHIPRPSTLSQARQIHLKSFTIEEIFDVKRPQSGSFDDHETGQVAFVSNGEGSGIVDSLVKTRFEGVPGLAHPSATVCWGSIRNRGCILHPRLGTFVLIRPAHTFYERIIVGYVKPLENETVYGTAGITISAMSGASVQAPPFIARGTGGSGLVVLQPKTDMVPEQLLCVAADYNRTTRWRFSWYRQITTEHIKRLSVRLIPS